MVFPLFLIKLIRSIFLKTLCPYIRVLVNCLDLQTTFSLHAKGGIRPFARIEIMDWISSSATYIYLFKMLIHSCACIYITFRPKDIILYACKRRLTVACWDRRDAGLLRGTNGKLKPSSQSRFRLRDAALPDPLHSSKYLNLRGMAVNCPWKPFGILLGKKRQSPFVCTSCSQRWSTRLRNSIKSCSILLRARRRALIFRIVVSQVTTHTGFQQTCSVMMQMLKEPKASQ